ncbi:acyltransferase [Arthrobacter psychrolactophilus]|uniref:Acyltransferase n=2 Tax=Arthrobacter psychrolactophilus TaxID=92442 RepID=A0A2V5JMY4_9MICC|nr:acyltransferase [Arthrobacter psychrolactophilus]
MMANIGKLANFLDESGNRIEYKGNIDKHVNIIFHGRNNRIVVHKNANFNFLDIEFFGNEGQIEIGENLGVTPLKAFLKVGSESKIVIGNSVSNSMVSTIVATEGCSIVIGSDVMLSSDAYISTGDEFPVYDVESGLRVNPAKSIRIGNHVWLARRSTVSGGANIGDGSVIGFGSLVDGVLPNNCIAAGIPARIIKKNIAWERIHLSLKEPFYKPDASAIQKSPYWAPTVVDSTASTFLGYEVDEIKIFSRTKLFIVNIWKRASSRFWK